MWVDGAPCIDVDSDEDVCSFIDTYVSWMFPCGSDDKKHISKIVKQYQTHLHSSYCRHSHSCWFVFPKAPSLTTLICREPEDDEKWDEILKSACHILSKVYNIIDSTSNELNLVDALQQAGVSEEAYISALKVTCRGWNVILKRNPWDAYTNGCNHEILQLWGANIDFQFVLDEHSTITYVCSYMMKSEKAMEEVLKNVSKECQSDPIDEQLKKIGKAFIGNCVVGAPEAALRELSMWLMKKSRKVTFINSNVQDDHISPLKSTKMLHKMDEDEDNVYMTSIHDRYAAHPDYLEGIC